MLPTIFIIPFLIIFFSCGKDEVNCVSLENTLKQHPHLTDLEIFLSTSEAGNDFIENCNSYYDEMESLVNKGCINDLNIDSVSMYRNTICGGPLVGIWHVLSFKNYDSPDCSGPYSDMVDTVHWNYGSRLRLILNFNVNNVTQKIVGSYSGQELCSMGLGTMEQDTCNTFVGSIPIDSLCETRGGVFSTTNDSCNYDILLSSMDYKIDQNEITFTIFSDTNSVDVLNGYWNINNGSLLNISIYNTTTCIEISASK